MSRAEDRSFILLHGADYLSNSYLFAVALVPLHYAHAVYAIEGNLIMAGALALIHPLIGVVVLITLATSVGDRADVFYAQFYADIFTGAAALMLLVKKVFEVMQMAKIELKRLKKKKKLEEEGGVIDKKEDLLL